jgi:hypothetical protein
MNNSKNSLEKYEGNLNTVFELVDNATEKFKDFLISPAIGGSFLESTYIRNYTNGKKQAELYINLYPLMTTRVLIKQL